MSNALKHKLVTASFIIVGLINFAPIVGVTGELRLENMYGLDLSSGDTVLLMRHRAILLAIVGGLLIASAFRPRMRPTSAVSGLVSMASFIVLHMAALETSVQIATVAMIDVGAIALLLVALFAGRKLDNTVADRHFEG